MPVPRRRRSKRRRDMQRTHKKLTAVDSGAKCSNCGALIPSHRICPECGQYKGRSYRTNVNTAS